MRRRRVRRPHIFEDVVIDFDAMRLLARRSAQIGKRLESPPVPRTHFVIAKLSLQTGAQEEK